MRVVVPGYIGARSVKWLEGIAVRSTPWAGYFQDVVYRLLREDQSPAPGIGMPLGLVALNSDVVSPADGARVAPRPLEIRGYAFSGGERSVSRVDVSLDRGVTWEPAELLNDHCSRMGHLGRHAARGRSRAVEPKGVRQQRPPPHHRARGVAR